MATSGLLALGVGCSAPVSPTTGIDELVIPTPSPDAADFVGEPGNPWLALEVGAVAQYDVIDQDVVETDATRTVRPGPDVAGVATVAVVTDADGVVTEDWLAEDTAGNVWWFGRAGEWQVGPGDGVQAEAAGLLMAAEPRRGDGYRAALVEVDGERVVDVRTGVVAVDATTSTPAGEFEDLVVLDTRVVAGEDADATRLTRTWYAEDVGLVRLETVSGQPAVRWLLEP